MKDVATLMIALAGLAISGVVAYMSARADAFRRASSALKDFSTGEVGEARHAVGNLSFRHSVVPLAPAEVDEGIKALFVVYWAVERLLAMDSSFSLHKVMPSYGAHRLLVNSMGHWVEWAYVGNGLQNARDHLWEEGDDVHDKGEKENLVKLARRWKMEK